MCGIAGFFDPDRRIDPALYDPVAAAMAARLAHRGPDGSGAWCEPEGGIALGFRRLAILDRSPAGDQPMRSADGRFVVVFNGEIYNHHELRHALEGEGARAWRGHSDTEVLVETIARWGIDATLERLDGMFALALWDRRERRLTLARDRLGEKPLYYGWSGGVLLLASELKALAPHPCWTGALDRGALALFLSHNYVPGPWSAFAGMRKLPPGHAIEFSRAARDAESRAYWSAPERAAASAAAPFAGTEREARDALQTLIDEAVALRMEADVGLGVFLSGGIDSTTVVAAMQAARKGPVRSFCVGFPDAGYDESPHAAAVARHLGTDHTTLMVSEAQCLDLLPRLAQIYDEPFADASQIPTLALCRLTREHVTVALSGDGGDELFGGYDRYRRAASSWARLERRPHALRALAGAAAASLAGRDWRPARRLRRLLEGAAHRSLESLYRDHLTSWRPSDGLTPGVARPATLHDAALEPALPSLEQRFMLRDAMTYLPDDLLVKVDRASMAFGLEVRAPLLAHRIAEFAWSLPPALAGGKRLLREALYERVPRALVDRPKHGFEPPLARWLREALRDWADDLLNPARLARSGMVQPALVASRWSAHRAGTRNWSRALWPVLMLEAWLAELNSVSAPLERRGLG
ncbi:MAG TPA: asparagine synthase (glutamine-hydrolyzing) [Stellaceae bacterium]|nr:asparagine synthase (glutamine-hydrolyzing) [Stellaceae bacterium]